MQATEMSRAKWNKYMYVCTYISIYIYISYTHIHDMILITGLVIYLYISSKKAYIRV